MSNQANKNSYRNKLKKRRKKFAANVKGFGKLGNYGRGSHIEQDEWNYFINIMTSIKAGFESLDDKCKWNFQLLKCIFQCYIDRFILFLLALQ